MVNRQAFIFTFFFFLLVGCKPVNEPPPTPTAVPTILPSPTVSTPVLAAPSLTPNPCLGRGGQVKLITFDSPSLPYFYIYLPECYRLNEEMRYPVLYLLHGQGYEADQWLRLGVEEKAASLMAAEELPPFIIVMPFDKASWRSVDDDVFGETLVEELIPFVDKNYRTLAKRESRAIGGLSRGAGWAIRYGLQRWELFGALGGHSAAIFYRDNGKLDDWLAEIPPDFLPKIYLDIGDQDKERGSALLFVEILAAEGIPHEWRLYSGGHNEAYWSAHVEEYLRWYGAFFDN